MVMIGFVIADDRCNGCSHSLILSYQKATINGLLRSTSLPNYLLPKSVFEFEDPFDVAWNQVFGSSGMPLDGSGATFAIVDKR